VPASLFFSEIEIPSPSISGEYDRCMCYADKKMKLTELEEIIECLPQGRTLFNYTKDWYAVELLKHELHKEQTVHELKQGRFSKLIRKPFVKDWLGRMGKSKLTKDDLAWIYPSKMESFRLTLDKFSGWTQTSRCRANSWNLVLQLNLNSADASFVERHTECRDNDPFEFYLHPVHAGRNRTLAWARIDVDLKHGHALIEEIQNDRVRDAKDWYVRAKNTEDDRITFRQFEIDTRFFIEYWENHMKQRAKWWDEAILTAAIKFIKEELGIQHIFYHTPESGKVYKGAGAETAPTSVYTTLPKKFCFEQTSERPCFLRRYKNKKLQFHRLDL